MYCNICLAINLIPPSLVRMTAVPFHICTSDPILYVTSPWSVISEEMFTLEMAPPSWRRLRPSRVAVSIDFETGLTLWAWLIFFYTNSGLYFLWKPYCYCCYQITSIFSSGTLTGTACRCKRWVVLSMKFIKCKKSSHPFKHVFSFSPLIKWNYIYQHLATQKSQQEPLHQSTERRENLSEHRANGCWQLP